VNQDSPESNSLEKPARGRSRYRWLIVALAVIMAGALVVVLVSQRRIKGSVPGRAPILSLAVVEKSYLVATEKGVQVTKNFDDWNPLFADLTNRSHVSTLEEETVIRYEKQNRRFIARTFKLPEFETVPDKAQLGTAVAVGKGAVTFVAIEGKRQARLVAIGITGAIEELRISGAAPKEITALQVVPGDDARIYAGGLSSGLWVARGFPEEAVWEKLLGTPVRSVITDPGDPDVVLIGTPGGVLLSTSAGRSWRFTEMRLPIEALSTSDGNVYAITADRILYRSDDGDRDWEVLGQAVRN
jgi:hypothetical protein